MGAKKRRRANMHSPVWAGDVALAPVAYHEVP